MLIHPSVAGKFYSDDPNILHQDILAMLTKAQDQANLEIPKAVIAPHAGYVYSGPVAASCYACLIKASKKIKRVVILAPSHQYPVPSIATTNAAFYVTPLGRITIDQKVITNLAYSYVNIIEEAFKFEHALEVHLPFLQVALKNFSLVPLLVGLATPLEVAQVLEKLWGGPETLIIVSSDLSHYHSYNMAKNLDKKTASAIMTLDQDSITYEDACGSTIIKGLLLVAKKKSMKVLEVDLRNSGDTSGSKDRVVGYGAFHFKEE
jgi:MEMO1 family protein